MQYLQENICDGLHQSVNIAKFLRTSILKNICERLPVFLKDALLPKIDFKIPQKNIGIATVTILGDSRISKADRNER